MPMSRDEKIEKAGRLRTAHRKTKETLEADTVRWEVHPGSEIARQWTVLTAAYIGLEQTIKYLIAEENDKSIDDLIEFREGKARPTRTAAGLRVKAKLDKRIYPTGVKIPAAEMKALSLHRHDFQGEWNYEIHPRSSTRAFRA